VSDACLRNRHAAPERNPPRPLRRASAAADIGDALTIDGNAWVVIAKEPPFEQRRIGRLVCTPRLILQYRRGTRQSTNWASRRRLLWSPAMVPPAETGMR
jgi:hypothetical protein